MATVEDIISEVRLSGLTTAARWAPRFKIASLVLLVLENILVVVGLLFIFGEPLIPGLGSGGPDLPPETWTSSGSYSNYSVVDPPTLGPSGQGGSIASGSNETSDYHVYVGGAIVLFSRLVHIFTLLANAQGKTASEKVAAHHLGLPARREEPEVPLPQPEVV